VQLNDLSSGVWYWVCFIPSGKSAVDSPFTIEDDDAHSACSVFRTELDLAAGQSITGRDSLFFISCDRWVEDGDDGVWISLVGREDLGPGSIGRSKVESLGSFQGDGAATFVHLGDQVYMDDVVRRIISSPRAMEIPEMTELFRTYYRSSWGRPAMRRVLRRGTHLL
jgi:hypothetical protein